jgi:hypothetical protein
MALIVHHPFGADETFLEQIEERILMGASALANDAPIDQIEIEDVVRQSGVSRPALQSAYGSVTDLFRELGQRLTNELTVTCLAQWPDGRGNSEGPEEPHVPRVPHVPHVLVRVATKTRWALLIAAQWPLVTRLALKAEWPSSDPGHLMYRDVERDILEGIRAGCFSDMPPAIGVSLVLGCLRGAARDIAQQECADDYIRQVVFSLLLGLGANKAIVNVLVSLPASELPAMPTTGLASRVLSLWNPARGKPPAALPQAGTTVTR